MDMHTLLEQINAGQFSEREMTELPCCGDSPWGGMDNPEGVWAWNEALDQVIVGEGDLEVVSYEDARDIYK